MSDEWFSFIENNLDRFKRPAAPAPGRGSAVVIPLLRNRDGETAILFEKRALDLDVQPAEICFPGGRIEEGETPREAAVREACEELLVKPEQVRILGETEGTQSSGVITIHAYLGELKNYEGTFSPVEVDHVFAVPISWFLEHEPEKYMTVVTTIPGEDFPYELIPGGKNYPWRRRQHPIYFYKHPEGVIWGLTAYMVQALISKLK